MKKILLIGCGHMGSALLDSWNDNKTFNISVIDPNTYKILKRKYSKKISIYKSAEEIKNDNKFDIILFAVKPQILGKVISQYKFIFNKKILFISIVAGKKISFFEKNLINPCQIVRAMPNMPAFVRKGITCLCSNKLVTKKNKFITSKLFESVGKIIWLNKEIDIDKATAVSGSGPAYYFLFIEHLISEACRLGLNDKVAEKLVLQTGLGSLDLLLKSNKSVEELRKNIAIKGGTTEAAINIFENNAQLKKIIRQALNAAFCRSKKLGGN